MRCTRHTSTQGSPSDLLRSAAQTAGKAGPVVEGPKPPQEVVQARLRSVIAESPQVQSALQLKAKVAQRMGGPLRLPPAGGQGLPDGLKSGIEHLSGMSMDHVQVHYNSSQPAQLQAHAYAQGHHIHLAPGQAQHLPHEAWHVVQQQQGRVKPTTQLQGVAVNDQSSLEREADVMGARARQLRRADGQQDTPSSNVAAPQLHGRLLQRKIVPYKTSASTNSIAKYKSAAKAIAKRIDQLTQSKRKIALNWRSHLKSNNRKLNQWANVAQQYYLNPKTVPPFTHARFGYAVEELVNLELPSKMDNLEISKQFTSGNSRPDIVLFDKNTQVAWLDITAEDSEGHILDKDASGWTNRPYVAEILYDSLNLGEILSASDNNFYKAVGGYYSQKHEYRREAEEDGVDDLRNNLEGFLKTRRFKRITQGTQKVDATRDYLVEIGFNVNETNKAKVYAKGSVALAGISPSKFGFGSGTQKTEFAKEVIGNRANEIVNKKMAKYNLVKAQELRLSLQKFETNALTNTALLRLNKAIKNGKVRDALVIEAIAAIECLSLSKKAEEKSYGALSFFYDNQKIIELSKKIETMRKNLPDMNFNALETWHESLNNLLKQLVEVDGEAMEDEMENYSDEKTPTNKPEKNNKRNRKVIDDEEHQDEDDQSEETPRKKKVAPKPMTPPSKGVVKTPKSDPKIKSFQPTNFSVQNLNFGTNTNSRKNTRSSKNSKSRKNTNRN